MQPWIAVALAVVLSGSQAKEASIASHQPTSDDDVAIVGANEADDDESSEDGVSIDPNSDSDEDDDESERFEPLKPQVLLIKPWSILVLTGILAVALLLISALCFSLRQPSEPQSGMTCQFQNSMKVFVRGMFACRSNHIVVEDLEPTDKVSRLLEKTIHANEDLNTQMKIVLSIKGVPLDPDASLESSGIQNMETVHLRIVRHECYKKSWAAHAINHRILKRLSAETSRQDAQDAWDEKHSRTNLSKRRNRKCWSTVLAGVCLCLFTGRLLGPKIRAANSRLRGLHVSPKAFSEMLVPAKHMEAVPKAFSETFVPEKHMEAVPIRHMETVPIVPSVVSIGVSIDAPEVQSIKNVGAIPPPVSTEVPTTAEVETKAPVPTSQAGPSPP